VTNWSKGSLRLYSCGKIEHARTLSQPSGLALSLKRSLEEFALKGVQRMEGSAGSPRLPRRGSRFAATPRSSFSYSSAGPITSYWLAVTKFTQMSILNHVAQLQQNQHLRKIARLTLAECALTQLSNLEVPLESTLTQNNGEGAPRRVRLEHQELRGAKEVTESAQRPPHQRPLPRIAGSAQSKSPDESCPSAAAAHLPFRPAGLP
jgi:hypothetical protein